MPNPSLLFRATEKIMLSEYLMDTSEANQIEMDKACSAPAKVFFSGEKLNRF